MEGEKDLCSVKGYIDFSIFIDSDSRPLKTVWAEYLSEDIP
jgi:hypothetical protein